MNEEWYSTDNWYRPNYESNPAPNYGCVSAVHCNSTQENAAAVKKKRRSRWIGLVVVFAAIATGAVAGIRVPARINETKISESGNSAIEYPSDYNDFFKSYYTSSETSAPSNKVKIKKAAYAADFSLKLRDTPSEELSLTEIYNTCAQCIVSISGYTENSEGYSWGSGIIISEDGLILTNAHIIENCDSLIISLYDESEFEASLVGADSISDIAVLKIETDGLPTVEFGNSDSLVVGQKVAAIGNPLGKSFRFTLTDGIISGIDRDMAYNGRNMALLQTNTAINNGNSGGALFNMFGQVIGITNMKMVSYSKDIEGIGFAIPSATVKNIADRLILDGAITRTTIGITCGGIPEKAAQHYGLPSGLYISYVDENYNAFKQGIRTGDILLAVNGTEVSSTTQVNQIKDTMSVGDIIVLTIWRAGETSDYEVELLPAA